MSIGKVLKLLKKKIFNMKNIFIINHIAGPGSIQKELKKQINDLSKDYDVLLYETKKEKDATRFVKEYLDNVDDTKL